MTRGHEKFATAVRILATSDGSIQERLTRAFVPHISSIHPERDLPMDLRAVYEDLRARVRVGGSIPETIAVMDAETASEIAQEVLSIQIELRERTFRP